MVPVVDSGIVNSHCCVCVSMEFVDYSTYSLLKVFFFPAEDIMVYCNK